MKHQNSIVCLKYKCINIDINESNIYRDHNTDWENYQKTQDLS